MNETLRRALEEHLRDAVHQLDITSMWLLHYNFEENWSLAIAHHIALTANILEQTPDNGEIYPEVDTDFIGWLQSEEQVGYTLHVDELDRDDPDWLEYVEKGLESASYMPVFVNDKPWGYIECWETRKKHIFTEDDFTVLKTVASKIAKTIAEFGLTQVEEDISS